MSEDFGLAKNNTGIILTFIVYAAMFAAWLQHAVWSIQMLYTTSASIVQLALVALGVMMPPFGAVHGVMIWFGMTV